MTTFLLPPQPSATLDALLKFARLCPCQILTPTPRPLSFPLPPLRRVSALPAPTLHPYGPAIRQGDRHQCLRKRFSLDGQIARVPFSLPSSPSTPEAENSLRNQEGPPPPPPGGGGGVFFFSFFFLRHESTVAGVSPRPPPLSPGHHPTGVPPLHASRPSRALHGRKFEYMGMKAVLSHLENISPSIVGADSSPSPPFSPVYSPSSASSSKAQPTYESADPEDGHLFAPIFDSPLLSCYFVVHPSL